MIESVGALRHQTRKKAIKSRPVSPGTVVIGIIDDGLAFGHERFRAIDGTTRVEAVWVQDDKYDGGKADFPTVARLPDRNQRSPHRCENWRFCRRRRSLSQAEAHQLRQRPANRPINAHSTHGAHVMDIACGFAPVDAPDWRIVCVQLPVATTRNTSGATLRPLRSTR